jgi:hypothetical protein
MVAGRLSKGGEGRRVERLPNELMGTLDACAKNETGGGPE